MLKLSSLPFTRYRAVMAITLHKEKKHTHPSMLGSDSSDFRAVWKGSDIVAYQRAMVASRARTVPRNTLFFIQRLRRSFWAALAFEVSESCDVGTLLCLLSEQNRTFSRQKHRF